MRLYAFEWAERVLVRGGRGRSPVGLGADRQQANADHCGSTGARADSPGILVSPAGVTAAVRHSTANNPCFVDAPNRSFILAAASKSPQVRDAGYHVPIARSGAGTGIRVTRPNIPPASVLERRLYDTEHRVGRFGPRRCSTGQRRAAGMARPKPEGRPFTSGRAPTPISE